MPGQIGDYVNVGRQWIAIGSIAALGIGSILLTIAALAGFQSSSAGDLVATSMPSNWLSLAILLAGTLSLLGMEFVRSMRRRQKHAGLAAATGRSPKQAWRP